MNSKHDVRSPQQGSFYAMQRCITCRFAGGLRARAESREADAAACSAAALLTSSCALEDRNMAGEIATRRSSVQRSTADECSLIPAHIQLPPC